MHLFSPLWEEAHMPEIKPGAFREEHFTPKQLGKLWGLSADFIRRRLAKEPGVLKVRSNNSNKRQYVILRIPASEAARVYAELPLPPPL